MEVFRNYISRNDKKLTMEDSWSKVCCRWSNSLDLTDVKDLLSLIDGKKYLIEEKYFEKLRYFREKYLRYLRENI